MQLELSLNCTGLRQAFSWLQESLDCTYWTRRMHADHARYLVQYFGDVPVTAIKYPQLRSYYDDERRRGRSKETIRKRLSTLKMALREGLAHGVLERLPDWPVIRSDTRAKEGHWTLTQWEAVHRACDDAELRTWLAVGWWTGMHTSDLNRFRWQDVDLVVGTWIRRNTKTKAKPIPLPLPARLLAILRERYEETQPHPRDLVAGNMGHPNRAVKQLAIRADVPVISPIEATRHSCETFLEESGTTGLYQMAWMGLTSERMLQRHYRHVTAPTIAAGIAAVNAHA